MKIIVDGKITQQDLLRFRCIICGCVFDANSNEYKFPNAGEYRNEKIKAKCKCPCCHEMVYIYE